MRLLHLTVDAAAKLVAAAGSTAVVSPDSLAVIPTAWVTHVDTTLVPAVAQVWAEASQTLLEDLSLSGADLPEDAGLPDAAQFLTAARNRLVGIGDDVWEAARQQLAEGVTAGEGIEQLAARVRGVAGVSEARATLIARTEVIAASNAASYATAMLLDGPGVSKQWQATPDARTRETHRHADGQTVPLAAPFTVGGAALLFPGDLTGPVDEIANCRCSLGYLFEETTVQDQQDGTLVAAAEVHTGAMVALVPSEEDAQRLAVEGGEPADQLHVTLAYLGSAAEIQAEVQQAIIRRLRALVEDAIRPDYELPLVVDGFAVSMFNPPGSEHPDGKDRDPCVVLGLSGSDLESVRDMTVDTVREVFTEAGLEMPEQYTPWAAHVTLQYTEDPGRVEELMDRAGPVTFDAIRVAFGGENTDIPLMPVSPAGAATIEPAEAASAVEVEDWDDYFAAAISDFVKGDAKLREHWVHGEGAAKIRWPEEGAFRRCVSHLRKYVRDPEGLCAEYHHEATGKWPGEKRGDHADVSTDLADVGAPMDEPAVEPETVVDPEPAGVVDFKPGEHWHAVMHIEGVSTGLRTFTPGGLTWRELPFAFHWQYQSSAHGGMPSTVQVGNVTRVERIGDTIHGWGTLDLGSPEGLEYARKLVRGFSRWVSIGLDESFKESDVEYVWPDGTDLDVLDLAEVEPEEMFINAGRIGELTAVSVPAQQEATVEPSPELIAMFEVEEVAPETVESEPGEPIIAAGHTITIPDVPPAEWFTEPTDVAPAGALTVTDEGRIYGYLAPAGIAHRSFRNRRVEVPMGRVDYSRWMGGEAIVAGGGRVVAGPITMECGHMSPTASADSAVRMEHYDNTCAVVAKASVGENRHGVWIAGALEPGVTADQVSRMLACRLSGDWAPHPEKPGWREFVAALLVPVPGFPMARSAPSVRVAEGALVAAAVPVRLETAAIAEQQMMYAEGDRVQVVGEPHEPGQKIGTVTVINPGPAYGVVFDAGEDEPNEMVGTAHKWYVGEELAPAGGTEPVAEMPEPVAASATPDLQPVLEHIARRIGRDAVSRMASLRARVHAGN